MSSYRLPIDLEKNLDDLVQKTGRAKTYYVIEALKYYLEVNKERFLLEEAIKEFYEGDQETYSIDEARKVIGIAK